MLAHNFVNVQLALTHRSPNALDILVHMVVKYMHK